MDEVKPRPMRADAVRNRERLLGAARSVFAERGRDATLNDVAERAGVGIATVYRHFRDKEQLAGELFTASIDELLGDVHTALEVDDPWEAVVTYFVLSAERQAHDRALYELLTGRYFGDFVRRGMARLQAPVAELFQRAQLAGVMRKDVSVADAGPIFAMLGPLYDMTAALPGQRWRRYLMLLLDALRTAAASPLPERALTLEELRAGFIERRRRGGTASAVSEEPPAKSA